MIGIVIATVGAAAAAVCLLSNIFITVRRFNLRSDSLPQGIDELKILHLSDLHKKKFGKDYEKLLGKIPDERFDMVCFTGDLISRTETDISGKIKLMKKLSEIAPVYYISGNHESDAPKTYEKLCSELEKCGVNVLRNRTVIFTKNGGKISLSGLEAEKAFYKNSDGSYRNLPKMDAYYLEKKLGEKPDGFTILLAHSPFPFESYCEYGADLVLCGHVHGGAVRLPIVKGLLSPERKFFPKYSAGLYASEKTQMIVSRGLGKLRIFNNSEIAVINVKRGEKL